MLLGYTMAGSSCTVAGASVRYNETYVASRLGDTAPPRRLFG
jgi:hypothetical protein